MSLVPTLRHERTRVRETVTSYWRKATSIRDDRYRLVTTLAADGSRDNELYDLLETDDSIENIAERETEVCERLLNAAGL